ncbi:MAG: Flp family type IVb pilin [Actinomycetota bacterium]
MLSIIATLQTLGFTVKNRLQREETGATAVEYALMVGLIAVVMIVGLTAFGPQLSDFFKNLGGELNLDGSKTPTTP